jgi:hypothetical protein
MPKHEDTDSTLYKTLPEHKERISGFSLLEEDRSVSFSGSPTDCSHLWHSKISTDAGVTTQPSAIVQFVGCL